ncbi:MAG TPA: cupredoxin domain-containing protein [Acidimicrobiales bacterium]|nr:cupredoxin domain-containing protein [Acidimicrobiales bacterium]
MRIPALGACLLVAATTASLAACGSDDDGDAGTPVTSGSDGRLVVVAEDIAFGADAYEVTGGEVRFEYRNDGSIVHTLLIEGVDGFKLEVTGHGDVDEGAVDLPAGDYTVYCDVAGHRQAGMEATLAVS